MPSCLCDIMQLSMIPVILVILIVRLGEAQGWLPLLARSYGDDLAVIPLVLWMIRLAHRQLRKEPHWYLPASHGLLSVVFFLFVFEGLLPGILNRGTADYWDGIMYGLGFLYFHFIVNEPAINDEVGDPVLF